MGKDIYIIDSTLRDGEQAPGVAFSPRDKLQLAEMLAEAGADELEAGTPAMGTEECRVIQNIVKLGLPCKLSSWCRARRDDLEAACSTTANGVHISFPVSAPLLKTIGKDEGWVFKTLEDLISFARKEFSQVSVGALDATRTDLKFLWRFAESAAACGATRLRIADTVGIASPMRVMRLVRVLRAVSQNLDIEFHGHNDLGMAAANAISAAQAGAQALSVTVNGLGERAGNAPLEEVALGLPLAAGKSCRIRPEKLQALCSHVAKLCGRSIPADKPVTGSLIFTHESGIHSHGLLQNDLSYQPYRPQLVGRQTRLVRGKHSGRRAYREWDTGQEGDISDGDFKSVVLPLKINKPLSIGIKRPSSSGTRAFNPSCFLLFDFTSPPWNKKGPPG
jgi:homocitrate synthase NifV